MFPESACVETSIAAACVPRRKSIGFAEGQACGILAGLAVAGFICVFFQYTVQDGTAIVLALFLLILF